MLLFDRKKALNQIMGKPPGGENAATGAPSHGETLAQEAIDAVHAKDPKKYADAMKAMHMFHSAQSDPDQDGDEHSPVTGKA